MGLKDAGSQNGKWHPIVRFLINPPPFLGAGTDRKTFLFTAAAAVTLIFLITAGVIWFETRLRQKRVFEKMSRYSTAVKAALLRTGSAADRQKLQEYLNRFVPVTPDILYILVTDKAGTILAADNLKYQENRRFSPVRIDHLSGPVFTQRIDTVSGEGDDQIEIYQGCLSQDLFRGNARRGRKGEPVYDTRRDIVLSQAIPARLRIGFSAGTTPPALFLAAAGMVVTGTAVLVLTQVLMVRRKRKEREPLESIIDQLVDLAAVQDPEQFRQRLAEPWDPCPGCDADDIRRLGRALSILNERFIRGMDDLVRHHSGLEQIVDNRTRELNMLNIRLVRQIEERKEIESRLVNVQKLEAISTLAGGIAHEFNNLFMGITGYAALIKKQSHPDSPSARKAEKIMGLVRHGSESIKQLLGFARGGKYAPGPLNVNEVIRINLEMFNRTRKDIEIHVRYEPSVWTVYADRSQIEHVIMNLLINASEAMPSKGTITMETRNMVLDENHTGFGKQVSGRFVHILIRDQGRGIDKAVIGRIFDPFFTTKPMNTGTGLGLASVYGIVDNHGGFVTVESEPNNGATFNVYLPAADKYPQKTE